MSSKERKVWNIMGEIVRVPAFEERFYDRTLGGLERGIEDLDDRLLAISKLAIDLANDLIIAKSPPTELPDGVMPFPCPIH
jgi:hypothetical protein